MDQDLAFAQCAEITRARDSDRYLTALTAEPRSQRLLFALYAFYTEIASARDVTHEPQLAAIRLQWWRDALADLDSEEAATHPIGVGLNTLLGSSDLEIADLESLIDAFEYDLEDPLVRTWDDLDAWCDKTAGALMALALRVLGGPHAEIAELGGRAWGLTGLTRAFPHHAGAGRIYLPAEAFEEVDINPHQVFQGEGGIPMMAILLATLGRAQDYAALLKDETRGVPKVMRPAFSYVSLIDMYVAQIRRHPKAPYALHPEIPAFRRQWRLMTTSLLR